MTPSFESAYRYDLLFPPDVSRCFRDVIDVILRRGEGLTRVVHLHLSMPRIMPICLTGPTREPARPEFGATSAAGRVPYFGTPPRRFRSPAPGRPTRKPSGPPELRWRRAVDIALRVTVPRCPRSATQRGRVGRLVGVQ
jgi:hypothetical protein